MKGNTDVELHQYTDKQQTVIIETKQKITVMAPLDEAPHVAGFKLNKIGFLFRERK